MSFTHLDKARYIHKQLEKYSSEMSHRAAHGRVGDYYKVKKKTSVIAAIQADYDYLHGAAKAPGDNVSLTLKLEWIDDQRAGYRKWFNGKVHRNGFTGAKGREGAERILKLIESIYADYATGQMSQMIPELP